MNLTMQEQEALIIKAIEAQKMAYCPHTQYAVGVAILTPDNHIITAANVETPAGPHTICAEQAALANAFLQGYRSIKALALVNNNGQAPCGTCRQFIYDLCANIPLIIAKSDKTFFVALLSELLPYPFHR